MKRAIEMTVVVVLMVVGCGGSSSSSDKQNVANECGGCSLPPACNADGTAPSPYPVCSCGCFPGQAFTGGVCTENGCLMPEELGDGSAPTDASTANVAATKDSKAEPGACSGASAVTPDDPVEAPPSTEWASVRDSLPSRESDGGLPASIDPGACVEGSWMAWLPFGSAYVHVHQRDDGDCEVWLGGETEDPTYDGSPTQYCRFPSTCAPVDVAHGSGGPARMDSPFCT